jgi:response regulator RpfG family c-di-GMP phosphodiesterase
MPRSADDTNLAQEAVAPASAPPTAAASTILIVDDDPVVRSLMLDSLEDEGFSVIEAEDGVQACGVCDHRPNRFAAKLRKELLQ